MKTHYDFAILGGGAAGFFGAMAAAEARPGLRVVILEKGVRPLGKVRISGGGRCNVTHACFDPTELCGFYPRGNLELRGPFSRFQPYDTIAWFGARDVRLKTEPDGRVFPVSNRSETIVDCFLGEVQRLNIDLLTAQAVEAVEPMENAYEIYLEGGNRLRAGKLLMAPGGGSNTAYTLAKNLGHTIIPPLPSLFTFKMNDPRLIDLPGISVPMAEVRLDVDAGSASKAKHNFTAFGPLLITHWGLSGPAVLKLSAWGARELGQKGYQAGLFVNWVAPRHYDEIVAELGEFKGAFPRKWVSVRSAYKDIPERLWTRLVTAGEISASRTWAELSKSDLQRLAKELCSGRYQINGRGIFKDEFVTCGGVSLKEVNFQSMESRICPGLYFAGEFLDIDGLTGGFNFQAAWTTGWIAGISAAQLF